MDKINTNTIVPTDSGRNEYFRSTVYGNGFVIVFDEIKNDGNVSIAVMKSDLT